MMDFVKSYNWIAIGSDLYAR